MSRNIVGFVLIDAPHSALNNAGQDAGARTENAVVVKAIRKGRKVYPYISAQAWRYWWRTAIQEKFGWKLSPIIREAKVAFTSANPFEYPDDDVFGYMRAVKKAEGGTLTRLSPLKCSPLVSVFEHTPTDDFGVISRHEGDPVPFEHQFYSTTMKGIFSLDIANVGIFYDEARTGYKNLDQNYVETAEIAGSISKVGAVREDRAWRLPVSVRSQRCQDTLNALPYMYSTTKSAIHLTDVTPKFIILAVVDGGNHIFMNITDEAEDLSIINMNALKQVLTDYKETLLSNVYIGRQEGFLDSLMGDLKTLSVDGIGIKLSSPKKAIEDFAAILDAHMS
jgi:CRISPR-associated protein Cst2